MTALTRILEKYMWKFLIVLVNMEEIVTRHSLPDISRCENVGFKIVFQDILIIFYKLVIMCIFIVAWNRFSNIKIDIIT